MVVDAARGAIRVLEFLLEADHEVLEEEEGQFLGVVALSYGQIYNPILDLITKVVSELIILEAVIIEVNSALHVVCRVASGSANLLH